MADLFLPFTPKAKAIELKAIAIKEANGIQPYVAVDPLDLALRMDIGVVPPGWFATLEPDHRRQILDDFGRTWSAGSVVADGRTYVLLNPGHSPERHSPSLAEELVHVALGHPRSELRETDGLFVRTCQHEVESEAYAVAVALIMPYRTVFNHIRDGGAIESIPAPVPVSAACRAYRTKVSGMWRTAQSRRVSRGLSTSVPRPKSLAACAQPWRESRRGS